MRKIMLLAAGLLSAAAMSAMAANEDLMPSSKPNPTPITIEAASGDTLAMSCAEAKGTVKGHDGVVLKTGATHFDRYHRRDGACDRADLEMQPALVRTRDNALCFIGYTCETPEN